MSEQKRLHNVAETSQILGISKGLVYKLLQNSYLHALDLGGLKVSDDEIAKFINNYTGYSFKDIKNPCRIDIGTLN